MNQKVLIQRLKKENGFEENQANKDYIINKADSSLIKGNWAYTELNRHNDVLFKVANEKYNVGSFINYVKQKQKVSSYSPSHYLTLLYDDYQSGKIIEYEENHLADKYIDFKMIVNEYKEGILLFQLMEEEVWNKAVEDTVGLKNFYVNNGENYQWGERVNANIYSSTNIIIDQIEKAIEKKDSLFLSKENLYKKYNSGASLTLQTDSGIFEEGAKEVLDQSNWKVGVQRLSFAGKEHLVWIKEVLDSQPKKFNETKGAVISDYQEKLEKEWLIKLKSKYTVLVNDEVLNKVYKSLNAK
jgi:peptidyl-prolyl cis-trans isomerase SurA